MIDSIEELTVPETQLLEDYSHATLLAFSEVYVANNADYRPYMQSSYLAYLNEGQEFKTYLIGNSSSKKLIQAIEQFKQEEDID